jgi:UDP-N-acetylglucosamine 2-epimerase (non-hydrolysing)
MKIFIIVGTRPEYIKLAPVYLELQSLNELAENEGERNAGNGVVQRSPEIIPEIKWIHTNQHDRLILSDLLEFWDILPDYEFSLVNQGLSLAELAAKLLTEADLLFRREKPDLVIVQGDTLSAVQAALAAFYNHIRVAHVEAGLRTVNPKSPFPEELSRRVISQIADYHFCPSEKVYRKLIQEKMVFKTIPISMLDDVNHGPEVLADLEKFAIANNIFNTGNTGIDALFKAQSIINSKDFEFKNFITLGRDSKKEFKLDGTVAKKYILITSHRRENIDNGFQEALCESILQILQKQSRENLKKTETKFPKHREETIEFTICLHNNPQARENFLKLSEKLISMNISGLNLLKSVTYCGFIQLMQNAFFIITDSGGVQEEAAYLNKYTLIMREEAERDEYLEQGLSERLNPDSTKIKLTITSLISQLMTKSLLNNSQTEIEKGKKSLYGNGDAAEKIIKIIKTAPINFT